MTRQPLSMSAASAHHDEPPCGLVRRLAAMLYDGLLTLAILMLAAAIIVVPLDHAVSVGNPFFQLYLLLAAWLYFAICWRGGRTLGMKAWRIRIAGPEQPMRWTRTLIRFLVALASLLVFGIGFLWSLFHPARATWHDLASGTRLYVEPRRRPGQD